MFGLEGKDSLFDGRESFIEAVLTSSRFPRLMPSRAVAIETAGKHRIVTVPDGNMSLLRPLHTIMYNHLSKNSWILRGDAKSRKFKEFSTTEGEVFVSGDYESATDNLHQEVQKEILRLVLQQCSHVPNGVRQMAMNSLSLLLNSREDPTPVEQTCGQMMGNLLSFPLLCLVNYLCFKYFIPRDDVPVRINGDDIVFRSTEAEYNTWREGVVRSGLVLSEGKTMVDKRCFTLNSCLFYSEKEGVRGLPFLRAKAYFPVKEQEAILGLKGRFLSFCPNFRGRGLSQLRVEWLRENVGLINASRRSLTRGLGLPVKLDEVMSCGQWDREAWYLSFEAERPLPSRLSEWSSRPVGYRYCRVEEVTKEIKREQKEVAAAFVASAWEPPRDDIDEWNYDLVGACPNWSGFAYQRMSGRVKRARLLGLSVRNMRRFLRPDVKLFERASPRIHRFGVWRPCPVAVEQTRSNENLEEVKGEMVDSVWCSFQALDGMCLVACPVGLVERDDGSVGPGILRSPPCPAYDIPYLRGPCVPPDCLTENIPGRKVVFRDGPMRGMVFDRQ
jgi:hypothetical protein